mmetsp:Transcript_43129/g.69692  ORF Transcript_43129/g.69692 Transcript_43129/m.69692 type:complete len:255 (+) Transcript_43129:766-1530(+)
MSQDPNHSREPVYLKNVDELEGLQLKAVGGVDHEQRQVGDLGQVEHGTHLLRALHDGDTPLPTTDQSDWPSHLYQALLGIVLHQGLDQRRLATAWRAMHHNDERWRDVRVLVKLRRAILLHLLLQGIEDSLLDALSSARKGVGLWVVLGNLAYLLLFLVLLLFLLVLVFLLLLLLLLLFFLLLLLRILIIIIVILLLLLLLLFLPLFGFSLLLLWGLIPILLLLLLLLLLFLLLLPLGFLCKVQGTLLRLVHLL